MMEDLNGRVAVVTGAASGIGLGMAEGFLGEGMKVVLADVDSSALDATCKTLAEAGGSVLAVPTDVSDPSQVESLRDSALAAFGQVHVVCNNAGVGGGGPIWQVPMEVWHWIFGVNVFGVVHGIRSFVPLLMAQGEGHVVNTASAAGLISSPFLGPYCATKHAVVAMSETLAFELADTNVGVSVLCPMWVKTRIHESDRNAPPGVAEAMASQLADFEGMKDIVAGLVGGGLEPSVVAGKVIAAVKAGEFYVLPHDEVREAVVSRAESASQGTLPSYAIWA